MASFGCRVSGKIFFWAYHTVRGFRAWVFGLCVSGSKIKKILWSSENDFISGNGKGRWREDAKMGVRKVSFLLWILIRSRLFPELCVTKSAVWGWYLKAGFSSVILGGWQQRHKRKDTPTSLTNINRQNQKLLFLEPCHTCKKYLFIWQFIINMSINWRFFSLSASFHFSPPLSPCHAYSRSLSVLLIDKWPATKAHLQRRIQSARTTHLVFPPQKAWLATRTLLGNYARAAIVRN